MSNENNENNESQQTKLVINEIYFGKDKGASWIYQEKDISKDNLMILSTLENTKSVENAPVFYKDQKVGTVDEVMYSDSDLSLSLILKFSDLSFKQKSSRYFAKPNIKVDSIGCVKCNNFFTQGQSPCDCIFNSELVYVSNIIIENIIILDVMQDNMDLMDNRKILLNQFFGGAISTLVFVEDL